MGGGSSNSSTPAWQSKEIRFAPYIEASHSALLAASYSARVAALNNSPYVNYTDIDYEAAIVGVGYTITSFPTLYDMYGKFMSGFDVETLWGKSFDKIMNLDEVEDMVDSETTSIDAFPEIDSIPDLKVLARELNTVCSSSFVIGKALIESKRIKKVAEVSAEAKYALLSDVMSDSVNGLNWRKAVTDNYAELFKTFYLAAAQCTDANYKFATNDVLWNLNILDFERAALGVFHPRSQFTKQMLGNRRRSLISKFILVTNDTGQGALFGMQIAGPYGAGIGAIVGFHIGMVKMMIEMERTDLIIPALLIPGGIGLLTFEEG
jgi:hypothetical protein